MKFFDPKLNLGHILTILAMCGTLVGVWRAMEIRAVETDLKVQALEKQMASERQDRIERDAEIAKSLEKTADRLEESQRVLVRISGILKGKGLIDNPQP